MRMRSELVPLLHIPLPKKAGTRDSSLLGRLDVALQKAADIYEFDAEKFSVYALFLGCWDHEYVGRNIIRNVGKNSPVDMASRPWGDLKLHQYCRENVKSEYSGSSSSETSVKIHQLIWRHVPEDSNFINTTVINSNLHMALQSSTETSLTIHQSIGCPILQVA